MDSPTPVGKTKAVGEIPPVYERYLALTDLAAAEFGGTLAGRIVLVPSLTLQASELVLAAGIAGAASLAIESGPLRIQEANRRRICDFTVNSLDEAIRILKNQVRKRQAVAVCLSSGVALSLTEMLRRGLQPDLMALPESGLNESEEVARLWARLIARGARVLDLSGPASVTGSAAADSLDVRWRVGRALGTGPPIWLAKIDALFEKAFPGDPRCRWVEVAPLYFGRGLQFERFVRLKPEEAGVFRAILTGSVRSGEIPVPLEIAVGAGSEFEAIA